MRLTKDMLQSEIFWNIIDISQLTLGEFEGCVSGNQNLSEIKMAMFDVVQARGAANQKKAAHNALKYARSQTFLLSPVSARII